MNYRFCKFAVNSRISPGRVKLEPLLHIQRINNVHGILFCNLCKLRYAIYSTVIRLYTATAFWCGAGEKRSPGQSETVEK